MLKWRVALPGSASGKEETQSMSETGEDNQNHVTADQAQAARDVSSNPNTLPRTKSNQKHDKMEDTHVVLRTNVITKPPRKRVSGGQKVLRVEVHSDNDCSSRLVRRGDAASLETLGSDQSLDVLADNVNNINQAKDASIMCYSSSDDSLTCRRTSIASGFTSLVIEAAFETFVMEGFDESKNHSSFIPGTHKFIEGEIIKEPTGIPQRKSDTLSDEASRILTVCGNDTADDIYSEACMLFDSESTIYEKVHDSSQRLNKLNNNKRKSISSVDNRTTHTLPRLLKSGTGLDGLRNCASEAVGLDQSPSCPAITEDPYEDSLPKSRGTQQSRKSTRSIVSLDQTSVDGENLVQCDNPRGMSKSAEDLLSDDFSRKPSVTFDEILLKEKRKNKRFGSTWDKINFTGSLGKRRSTFLSNVLRFSSDRSDECKSGGIEENQEQFYDNEGFRSKRSSSDSQLLDNQSNDDVTLAADDGSQDSTLNMARSQTVNSSFRQRITKFFQDCPKYPLNNRTKKAPSNASAEETNIKVDEVDNKPTSSTSWPFKVKLVKIRKVTPMSIDEHEEKQSKDTTTIKSFTKNIYKITPRNKHPVETAKFYIDVDKDLADAGKEPLHDVQFFHTARAKLKPPDRGMISVFDKLSLKTFEKVVDSLEANFNSASKAKAKSRHNPSWDVFKLHKPDFENSPIEEFLKCDGFGTSTKSFPPNKSSPNLNDSAITPKPRTVFHSRISPGMIVRNDVAISVTAKYDTLSRRANHTFPKRRCHRTTLSTTNSPSSTNIYESLDLPVQSQTLHYSISPKMPAFLRSLTGGCPSSTAGAVVSGTNVSVNTGVSVPVHSTDEREHLMWCPDAEFDTAVSGLGIRGLIEVVQGLQEAMAVEQQTFDTLTMQLEGASDPLLQQRLSAALCTSQTRLARLCARNMRCFTQQALKSRHKEPSHSRPSLIHSSSSTSLDNHSSNITKTNITSFDLESTDDKTNTPFCSSLGANSPSYKSSSFDCRAASPRDSGLAVSSTAGSDAEHDFKSNESVSSSPAPPTESGPSAASFKHSLAFFQRAAHLVTARVRQKESRRRRSRGSSSGVDSAGSDCWSDTASEDLQSRSLDRLRDVRITSSSAYGTAGGDSKFLFGEARINYPNSKTLSSDSRSRYNDSSGKGGRLDHLTAERARSLGRESGAPNNGVENQHYSAAADRARSLGRDGGGKDDVIRRSTDDFSSFGAVADPGTYEQVLFINGRPQYQDDFRRSYSCEALDTRGAPSTTTTIKISPPPSHSNRFSPEAEHSTASSTTISSDGVWTRVHLDGSGSSSSAETADVPSPSNCSSSSVGSEVTSAASLVCGVSRVAQRASDNTSAGGSVAEGFYASSGKVVSAGGAYAGIGSTRVTTSATSGSGGTTASPLAGSSVTLPRRKPYLNLKSVTTGSGSSVINIYGSGTNLNRSEVESETDVFGNRESVDFSRINGVNIKRAHSFKDGLDDTRDATPTRAYPLLRTQSYSDGLAGDSDHHTNKQSLSRAPSIDEILETVRNLRAKKTMVNSSPDLYHNPGEPIYHSASMPRNKSNKKNGRTSAIIGVRYSSKSSDLTYDRVPEPHYEQIIENGDPYYENLHKDTHYENINNNTKLEVIYDRPRSNKLVENQYDQVHGDLHYENVHNYDLAVYENVSEKEPTYMNVHNSNSTSRSKKSRSKESKTDSNRSNKSRSKSSRDCSPSDGLTYDVPRSATHIYDTPKKYSRPVEASEEFAEYATPKNNRSVKSSASESVRLAKQDQKKKIDDIFADVDRDSLDGDCDLQPDIPPPDYGPEEEQLCGEYPDEGLGESDGRSYYTEEQGLEVILEEPEEDYCSSPVGSHSGRDLYDRDSNLRLKGERGSLDGSEGIGSAEGDSSAGGSDHYPEEEEEDCASSGIHSQDTPSPGTPVDQFKEDSVEEQPPRQEERVQKDRSLDVYPETLRQRQRHRNMAPSPSKVDIKNWNQNGSPIREPESPASGKKFLPSVKALRNQFETGKNLNSSSSNNGSVSPTSTFSMSSSSSNASTGSTQGCGAPPTSGGGVPRIADPSASLSRKLSGSSLASSSLEKSSSNTSLNSAPSTENLLDGDPHDSDEPVEPIFCQFQKVDEELRELMSRPTSTSGWDPRSLLKRLYYVPEVPRVHSKGHSYINIEGYLEKLPSGRKKATFWNAWKKRYFVAKDGVLYYYQNSQCDKQSLRLTLMGGKVETMEGNMVGVDDGKGHYVVVRCSSRSEADRWRRALESHLVEDFASQYVQPHPMSTNPSLLRDTLIIDIGSCSVRAGVLSSQATLPQLFFPSVVATVRESRRQVWGQDALSPETRSSASLSFPMKPSHRISKYSVDLTAVASLLTKTFSDLKVDPKNYNLQISVPRVLNQHTQSELLRVLFEKFGVKGVNVTHQSILALYAYNATSGIVVDIGERMDIVPVIDGYIVEGGVSRVPYGGCRILDHLRQFLYMRNVSLVNDVESYIIRHVLESACYCAQHYNTEKARCTNNPENFEKIVPLKEFFPNTAQCPYDAVELDFGRFQATEGLFNPDAWGLDHPGLHKLVHKAIQECSMDIRKEMSRSIFLAGGVTQLPGLADRLTTELDNLTPPAIRPKVHVSPYRYHAAYIGACTLAESPAFSQTLITRENWAKNGNAALRKWAL